jgi:hypothetical protein
MCNESKDADNKLKDQATELKTEHTKFNEEQRLEEDTYLIA